MDGRMIRMCQKKIYGGRSIVARTIDYIVFRLFLALFLFWTLLYLSRSVIVSLLISMFLITAISLMLLLIKRKRTQKYIANDLKRIKEKCLLEELTFMTDKEYSTYVGKLLGNISGIESWRNGFSANYNGRTLYAFHNHPSAKTSISDILDVLREKNEPVTFLSLAEFKIDVISLCRSLEQDIILISGKKVLELAEKLNMLPDEKTAQKKAENELEESLISFDKLKQSALNRTKIKRYLFCGIVIVLWSIVGGFKFYYPIIALLCFIMAILAFRKSRNVDKENSNIGLY